MGWTKDDQARLDGLRQRELAGTLTEQERADLASLIAQVEAEEAQALAPAMARLRVEVGELNRKAGLAAVAAWEAEHGRLTEEELVAADCVLDRGRRGSGKRRAS